MITERQDMPSLEISARQRKILETLVKEYIDLAEPISSEFLKKKCGLAVSPATIRNELQELTEQGYIAQPHTSAGRVPTSKGYRYFVEIIFSVKEPREFVANFIAKEIALAKQNIEQELNAAQELAKSLEHISSTLKFTRIQDKNGILEVLEILGPSRTTYEKHMQLIHELIKELRNFKSTDIL